MQMSAKHVLLTAVTTLFQHRHSASGGGMRAPCTAASGVAAAHAATQPVVERADIVLR